MNISEAANTFGIPGLTLSGWKKRTTVAEKIHCFQSLLKAVSKACLIAVVQTSIMLNVEIKK